MIKQHKKYNRGFGLLEVLVSSSIIIMILSSVVFIGRQAIVNSTYLQQRAQAIYLAQEGLEQVREMRDTNWNDQNSETEWNDWAYDGSNYAVPSGNYIIKYMSAIKRVMLSKDLDASPSGESITLDKQDFKRYVEISTVASTNILPGTGDNDVHKDINSLKVTVRVKWTNAGVDRETNVSEILTNWRPNF